MKHFDEFVWTGQSIATREPFEAVPYAAGCVLLAFANLRDDIKARIRDLVSIEGFDAWMSVGTRSLDNRMSLFGNLVRSRLETGGSFNTGSAPPLEFWSELEARCRFAISLWDSVVSSTTAPVLHRGRVTRLPVGKLWPKGKNILYASELMDIADMISSVICELEQFFLDVDRPPGPPV